MNPLNYTLSLDMQFPFQQAHLSDILTFPGYLAGWAGRYHPLIKISWDLRNSFAPKFAAANSGHPLINQQPASV